MESNKMKIRKLVLQMLENSIDPMKIAIDKALTSGCIDIDSWDENHNAMIIPKAILIAVMETEAEQYKAKGTSFEKQVKKEVKNIKLCI